MNKEKEKQSSTTQNIAIDFVQNALNTINKQLAVEIKRNGFDMELIRKGKQKLKRIVKTSEADKRYIAESFTVSGRKIPERIILCVKWSPTGFTMERNSDTVANAVKANKNFGVKKGRSAVFSGEITEREIEIEAIASKYEREEADRLKKESGLHRV